MRTILKVIVLLISGLVVFSACTSSNATSSSQVEQIIEPSPTPKQMTQSEINERQSTVSSFLFYNSYASW